MGDTELIVKENKSQGSFWERAGFWKLATAKLACLCILSSCASVTASLNGVLKFSEMSAVQIVLAIIALISAVTAVVLAFLSDTMAQLKVKAEAERKSEMEKTVTTTLDAKA